MQNQQRVLPLRPHADSDYSDTTSTDSEDDMDLNQERGLYDDIKDALTYSEFSRGDFLPQDDFETLVTERAIEAELNKVIQGTYNPSLVEYIATYARKTFATLVIQDKVHKAAKLEKFKFDDKYLPIAQCEGCITSLSGLPKDRYAWKWFSNWRKQEKDDFCARQWIFLAPIFKEHSTMEELHRDCRLPFIACDSKGEGGSFSLLHKATIHRAHQTVRPENLVIAIKELRNKEVGADQRELAALDLARQLDHQHIVRFVGGFRQGSTSYLLFQWADGGNLRSYWNDEGNWSRNGELIRWTIEQIGGLVAALGRWHDNHDSSSNIALNGRHGDLKPENILRSFGMQRGIFQIADLGLAKIHSLPTHARNKPSSTPSGTFRYRPPEINPKISRSYDMWGMGCIILEWIIWLVYGIDGLKEFSEQAFPEEYDAFWSREGSRPTRPEVIAWMKHMTDTCLSDGEQCYSIALRRLLVFVRDRLLVPDATEQDTADMFQQSVGDDQVPIYITPAPEVNLVRSNLGRAKSRESCEELQRIGSIPKNVPNYMYNPRVNMSGPNGRVPQISSKSPMLSPTSNFRQEQKSRDLIRLDHQRHRNGGIANTKNPYAMPGTLDVWISHFDNLFAKTIFGTLDKSEIVRLAPAYPILTPLCQDCSSTDTGLFSRGSFVVSYEKTQATQTTCSLCTVLYKKMNDITGDKGKMVLQEGSSLVTARGESPLLSLVVGPSPGLNRFPGTFQRGFPILPTPGSPIQIKLLNRWIKWCDSHHECKPTEVAMPSRLIDVYPNEGCKRYGHQESSALRLDCNTVRKGSKYVALTHRWGNPSLQGSFHFLSHAKLERWQNHLDLRMLPQTFQDAVKITRSLGLRYLWIDALCIIQDDEADLQAQIGKMEDVFRCAYVTLSATCATGSDDGFLKTNRKSRSHYPLSYPNELGSLDMIYLCDPIDDFERHVEQSALSKRGWVFQERALSRRIIHFTEVQVYWECGAGIRCETLTTLYNHRTSFLSDPQFPDAMLKRYKGMRIAFFEEIYERYSQLNFTHCTDRSLGMAGIESRFATLFGKARHGILDDSKDRSYLHRTLLWRRADLTRSMTKIKYPPNKRVLSWSWMAVMGPICFMDVPFGSVNWTTDLESPFNELEDLSGTPGVLRGVARDYSKLTDDHIFFDRDNDATSHAQLKCVVLGTQGISSSCLVMHYALLVATLEQGSDVYERVGVAMFERDQDWMDSVVVQRIRIM